MATAPPAMGLAIEVGSLNELSMMSKKIRPYDTIKLYTQGGTLIYAMHEATFPTSNAPSFNNVKPFEILKGGTMPALNDFVGRLTMNYQSIATKIGIDQYTSGTQRPNSDTTAVEIRAAVASTQDSIKPIYSAWISIQERMAMNVATVAQQLIVDNTDKDRGYYGIISDVKINAIKEAGKYPPAEYGFQSVALPSRDEIAEIMKAAQAATMGGKNGIPALAWSEYLFIQDSLKLGRPVRLIHAYIAYKEAKRKQEEMQRGMAMQEFQIKKTGELESIKNKNKIDLEQAKGKIMKEIETMKIIGKWIEKFGTANLQGLNDLKKTILEIGADAGKTMAQQGQQGQQQMQPNPQEQPQEQQQSMMQQ
jgi:hypothetical protein